jgi:hypothetical protein
MHGPADGWSRFTSSLWHFGASTLQAFRTLEGTVATINNSLLINGPQFLREFGLRLFGSLCTSHFETPEAHSPERWDQLPPIHFNIDISHSLQASTLFKALYFMQFRNSKYPGAANLILKGDLHYHKIELACLYFKSEMSWSACYTRMFPVKTTNLDDLLPLTTICDNRLHQCF